MSTIATLFTPLHAIYSFPSGVAAIFRITPPPEGTTVLEKVLFSFLEFGVHGDPGIQESRYGAAFFGAFGGLIKFCLLGAGNFCRHLKVDGGHGKAAILLFQGDGGSGL